MFDFEKEVPSLELCKKLKELGYPQTGGGLYWDTWGDSLDRPQVVLIDDWDNCWSIMRRPKEKYYIKAPTLGEMGEVLPAKINALGDGSDWFLRIEKREDCWYVTYGLSKLTYCVCFEKGEQPDAYARMLIWLAENGYLSFGRKEANNVS